jgi:hypothetical protein
MSLLHLGNRGKSNPKHQGKKIGSSLNNSDNMHVHRPSTATYMVVTSYHYSPPDFISSWQWVEFNAQHTEFLSQHMSGVYLLHFEKPLGMSSHRLQGASQSHLQQMQVLADYWLQLDLSVHSHSESKKVYWADLSLYCCSNCQRHTELLLRFNTQVDPLETSKECCWQKITSNCSCLRLLASLYRVCVQVLW